MNCNIKQNSRTWFDWRPASPSNIFKQQKNEKEIKKRAMNKDVV